MPNIFTFGKANEFVMLSLPRFSRFPKCTWGRTRVHGSMLAALQKKDWKAFARLYNGPAYAQNGYDEKLSTAYSSFKHHTVCPRVRLRDLGIR